MKKWGIMGMVVLGTTLAASLCINYFFYTRASSYYKQLQAVRLDPSGSRALKKAKPAEDPEKKRFLIFGDSRAAAWSGLEDQPTYEIINRGIGNQTTTQMIIRLERDVLALTPDIVLIQAGINDLKAIPLFPHRKKTIIKDCQNNLMRMIDACVSTGMKVIASTIFPAGKPPPERKPFWSEDVGLAVEEVNAFLKTLKHENLILLDGYSLLVGQGNLMNEKYAHDLLHLNKSGYTVLNKELKMTLESL